MATVSDSVFQGFEVSTPPMHLLMLGYTNEGAAAFASALRNSGVVAHIDSADGNTESNRLLKTVAADLVTLNLDADNLSPEPTIEAMRESNPGAALILVSTRPSAYIGFAYTHKARDLLEAGDHQRLALAVKREYETLRLRQELTEGLRDLVSERDRFQGLLEASSDAIAYLHEGMHLDANTAYCELFGATHEEIDDLPVMDFIAADARAEFKKTMHQVLDSQGTVKSVRCRRSDGREFDVDMELSPSSCNGEACIRIIVRRPSGTDAHGSDTRPDLHIAALIDDALEHNRLQLLYQPIVSLVGDTRESYSIFVTLPDEDGQQPPPGALDELACRAGSLTKIDRWLVRHAIEELTRQNSDHKINFHVQLSREGALDNSMLSWVCDCLREFKVKGNGLYFQFDYELLLENPPALESFIDGLKKINCRIACNNVVQGAVDQTLQLRQPIDIARYATSVTESLRDNPASREPLAALNARIHEMGIKTLAGGVDDAHTLELLWWMGVDQVQGEFLQKAVRHIYARERK